MSAVLSRRDIDLFTPDHRKGEERPPVYHIAPLTWRERAVFNRTIAQLGIAWRTDDQVVAAVRSAVEDAAPDNLDELLSTIDAFQAALAAREEATASADIPQAAQDAPNDDASTERNGDVPTTPADMPSPDPDYEKLRLAYIEIEQAMRRHPNVSALIADRVDFNLMAPGLAASFALRGWDNVKAAFIRRAGVVPDEVLDQLPEGDLQAIGWRAFTLMRPSESARKN